jgi:FixJ family two-component response regulator
MKTASLLVAVVDDEESIRKALVRLLRSANYLAEAFASPTSFLESLSERVPYCVVLDLQMPIMTGFELQERLNEMPERPRVIVITAHDEPGIRERCKALGAERCLIKPIDGDLLLDSIRRLGEVRRDEGDRRESSDSEAS